MPETDHTYARNTTYFRIALLLIFLLSVYNVLYKITWDHGAFVSRFNLWNPTWLLFGPLLTVGFLSIENKKILSFTRHWIHFVPYFLFQAYYLFTYAYTDKNNPWSNTNFVAYQNAFFVISISLLAYSFYLLARTVLSSKTIDTAMDRLVISLSGINILVAIIGILMYTAWGIAHIDTGIDYRLFTYGLLLVQATVICIYWLRPAAKYAKADEQLANHNDPYARSPLTNAIAATYMLQVEKLFQHTTIYLRPDLNLGIIALELDIPKHLLSQLFNLHFQMSFHTYVARYRIDHSKKLMREKEGKVTIESLSYSCGFNSKTSFNKYFREVTGVSPSEYQAKMFPNN